MAVRCGMTSVTSRFPNCASLGGLWRIWSEVGATQQVLSAAALGVLARASAVGRLVPRLPPRNVALHSASAVLVVRILRRLAVPGRPARRADIRAAPDRCRIGGVDFGTEEHAFGVLLPRVGVRVFGLRETGLKPCADRAALTSVAQPFRAVDYWLAFALFLCALLSKTVTATLPAALLVVLWWQRGRLRWQQDVLPLVPWFAVAIAAGLVTAWFERDIIGARGADFELTLIERVLVAGRAIWFYAGKLTWPANLMFWYPRWTIDLSVWWQYAFPAAAVALAIGLGVLARRRRGPLAGFLYFCGTLFPVLGFFDVYPFRFSYVADHFQYLASLGIIVPAAAAVAMITNAGTPARRRAGQMASAFLIAALGILTWRQSAMYGMQRCCIGSRSRAIRWRGSRTRISGRCWCTRMDACPRRLTRIRLP